MIVSETEVIRIYEVYIDVYFIENVIMDAELLILTLLLLGEKISLWRLVSASLTGGLGAVLILLSGMGFGIGYILCAIMLDAVMLLICTQKSFKCKIKFQKMAIGVIYLHGMVFAYGKLTECAYRLTGERMARISVILLITGITFFLAVYRNFSRHKQIYEVVLMENGEKITAKALFDTGNLLKDPVSGKPVSVMEETDKLKEWLMKYPNKYKIIPYQSIGNEHGLLEGIMVDKLMIQKENEQVIQEKTIVALYKGRLSKDGAFQMILNNNLV